MSKVGFTRDVLLRHVDSFKNLVIEVSNLQKEIESSEMDEQLKKEILRIFDEKLVQATEAHISTMNDIIELAMDVIRSTGRDE